MIKLACFSLNSRVVMGLLMLISLGMAGCASVTGGSSQPIYVSTVDTTGTAVEGLDCSLSNDKGRWQLRSPNDTTITRSNKPLIIRCEKTPLPVGAAEVESATRAAMFGNAILGGLVGAAIDHSSGAAYEYPGIVKVILGGSTKYKLEYDQRDKTYVARQIPAPSLFADIKDTSKMPITNERIRSHYLDFLNRQSPKAYAISVDGRQAGAASGLSVADKDSPRDPAERALQNCQRTAKTPCVLYVVDDQVVYVKPTTVLTNASASAKKIAESTPTASTSTEPLRHSRAMPAATNYAPINDAQSVPSTEQGKGRYLHYLTLKTPKAFAVYENGGWRFASNDAHAMTKVLDTCEREGKKCWLYAVDDQVVWQSDIERRIGRSNQLIAEPQQGSQQAGKQN